MTPERKIVALLVLLLLCLEGTVRLVEPTLSKDLAHVASLRELPERLPPGAGGVLVLGNSLARCSIDGPRLSAALPGEPPVAFLVPDATGIAEWAWGYRRHVAQAGARPAIVLLVTGRPHLFDPPKLEIDRLAAFHVGPADRRAFLTEELAGFEDRSRFLLAASSRLFANRGRVQPLAFYNLVPGYTSTVERINRAAGGGVRRAVPASGDVSSEAGGLRQLDLLLRSIRETGARLIVVTVPQPDPWILPEPIAARLAAEKVSVIPLSEALVLPLERFPDRYHLDGTGARLVTDELVRRLE